jgi:peptidoglycan pentaglycine glycine transferase (the first glycine)
MLTWELLAPSSHEWNSFVHDSPYGDVLQMWQWGEMKKTEGWTQYLLAIKQDDQLLLVSQILTKPAGLLGIYAYCPHGPVWYTLYDLTAGLSVWKKAVIELGKKHNWFLLDIEPKLYNLPAETELSSVPQKSPYTDWLSAKALQAYVNTGFRKTGRNMQPMYKLISDLTESEENVLAKMKKNTRYNVKQGVKNGIKITQTKANDPTVEAKLDHFYDLLLETQKRAGGYPVRPRETFSTLFQSFKDTDNIGLFSASYEGEIIVSNISFCTKYWSSSFYAGSNRLHPKLRAPYLLRWESMLSCKEYGSQTYDFWGIVPSKEHSGYSDNKLSFGGVRFDSVGLLSLHLKPTARFWSIILKTRRWIADIKRKIKK